MIACQSSHKEVIEYLVSQGAKLTIQDYYGKTAMDFAKTEEIKKILQSSGTVMNSKFFY